MPDFLITYDLQNSRPDPHKPFLVAAQTYGLLYVWKGETYVNRLPNTTVWGVFDTVAEANKAFGNAVLSAAAQIGIPIVVEKRVTTEMRNSSVRSNKRKPPVPEWIGTSRYETAELHQLHDSFF